MKTIKRKISRVFGSGSGGSGAIGTEPENQHCAPSAAQKNGADSFADWSQRQGDCVGGPILAHPSQMQMQQQFPYWWKKDEKNKSTGGQHQTACQFFPGGCAMANGNDGLRAVSGQQSGMIPVPASKQAAKSRYRWSLSDSLSQLGERIAEMTVEEETATAGTGAGNEGTGARNGNCLKAFEPHVSSCSTTAIPSVSASDSHQYPANGCLGNSANASGPNERPPLVLMRANKKKGRQYNQQQQQKTKSWHASRWFGNFGHTTSATTAKPAPLAPIGNDTKRLGSEGESLEVSPSSSSDQHCSSACSSSKSSNGTTAFEYVPNVKMRQKGTKLERHRWNEAEIQKRLSLPAYISIPPSVIEKLNRTAAAPSACSELTNSLLMSRKSRRASLNEIGFGRLETYKKILDLGSGTYAKVFLGQSLLTGRSVALKEIRLEHEEGAPCTAIREVSLLRNLRHANIVTLHDVVHTDSVLTLVFEFVEQDLREYMEELEGPISIANVKLFLIQLLRGLAYCHTRRILHRDLKPQNLLITKGGELKLADFGLARAQSIPIKTYSAEVVTLWYRPPDLLLGSIDYTTHIDMWAVGCILYEMLQHRPMFPGGTPSEQLALIFQKFGTPRPETHPEMCALPGYNKMKCRTWRTHSPKSLLNPPRINLERANLLMKLLQYDGKQRISAECAMRHPFLNCFPEALFELADTESIYTLAKIQFVPDKKISSSSLIMEADGFVGEPRLLEVEPPAWNQSLAAAAVPRDDHTKKKLEKNKYIFKNEGKAIKCVDIA